MSFPLFRSLLRVSWALVILFSFYLAAIVLLMIPFFQSNAVYLNYLRLPLFADFDIPEKYGLSPNKTFNMRIHTQDNETLGAWFILSDAYYKSLPSIPHERDSHVMSAIANHPTILFFHGNAATRAFRVRISLYKALSSRLSANVLALDYRGFADSTGCPSEAGLVLDGKAAWDWLISQGAKQENVIIFGQSLGTGVAAQLVSELSDGGIRPRGVVLLSPFASIQELLKTYSILGVVPLLKPLAALPFAQNVITSTLISKFDSLNTVPRIKGNVIIAHALDDRDIPPVHSDQLFDAFLRVHLPVLANSQNEVRSNGKEHSRHWFIWRNEMVQRTDYKNFGTLEKFDKEDQKVSMLKTFAGGHDYLGLQEGVQDFIRLTFQLV